MHQFGFADGNTVAVIYLHFKCDNVSGVDKVTNIVSHPDVYVWVIFCRLCIAFISISRLC